MVLLGLLDALREGIGESDCEVLRDEALAQPVNAISSFSYVVIGVIVFASARLRQRPLVPAAVYSACLVGVGLGSVLFHGPQPAGSRILHDLPIVFTVLFIVAYDLELVWNRVRRPLMWFVGGAIVATALMLIDADLGGAATGIGVGAIAVLESVVYRRRLRPAATRRQRQGYVTIIGVTAVAATTWLLGRSDSPVCDPEAVLQLHGLWHVLSAIVFGLWWWLAFDAGRPRPTDADTMVSEHRAGRRRTPTSRSER